MPGPGFYAISSDARPQVSLLFLGGKEFRLQTAFRFVDTVEPSLWTIHAHHGDEKTDLASSPPWLWGLTASYGKQLLPALLHDQRDAEATATFQRDRGRGYDERRQADLQFRRALTIQNVPLLRAGMFWSAVTLQRQFRFGRPLLGVCFALQLLLAALTFWGLLVVGLPLGVGPLLWAFGFLATVLVLPLAQGRDYLAGVAGSLCAPVVLAVLVVTLVANVALWLLDVPYLVVRSVAALLRGGPVRPWPAPVPTQYREFL